MKVDVLGTEYEIIELTETDKLEFATKCLIGQCNLRTKQILLNKSEFERLLEGDGEPAIKLYKAETIRHELLHVIFHETGHSKYADDEKLVDCLAVLFPKILKIFHHANAI